jgi:hypothetical protein
MAKIYKSIDEIESELARLILKATAKIYYDNDLQAALDDFNKAREESEKTGPTYAAPQMSEIQLRASHPSSPSPSQGR